MGTLTDFLNEQAEIQRRHGNETKQIKQDWVQAVNRLVDQMESWLRQADQSRILEIQVDGVERREERIGRYTARRLTVRLGAREVEIGPVARFIVAAPPAVFHLPSKPQGRVDITDGGDRVSLYLIPDAPEGRWVMIDEAGGLKGFDQDAFETVMRKFLG